MFNLNFLIILLAGFIDYLGIGLVYPIFGVMLFDSNDLMIASEASTTYRGALLGILMGLTPLSAFIFAPFLGSYSDCRGRKKALILGMWAGCLGYFLAIVAIFFHSLFLLFIFRILVGITEGSAAVAQAAIADFSTESNKARRFSLFSSSAGLGFTLGPFIGSKLGDPQLSFGIGYATPFIVAGILCLINLILIWALFPNSRIENKQLDFNFFESVKILNKVSRWKQLQNLFAACFLLSFAWAFFNEFMPVLLKEKFDFTLNEIGNYFAWGGFWYFLSTGFLTAPLLSLVSSEKLLAYALAGCALSMAFFSFMPDSLYIWMTLPLLMYCLSLAFPTLTSMVSNKTESENQGEVLGVYYSIQGCAMGLSPIFAGPIIGAFPILTGIGGAFIMLLAYFSFQMKPGYLTTGKSPLIKIDQLPD